MNPNILRWLEDRRNKWLLGIGSFLAMFCLLGSSMGLFYGFLFTSAFMAHLFVHEMGHVWAMKRSGMKVRTVNFIPFLGAVAVPDDQFPSRRVECFVAIMGPAWGGGMAILTVVLGSLTHSPFLKMSAGWMTIFNLMNLLPVSVLDGGRIWKSVIYSFEKKWRLPLLTGACVLSLITLLSLGFLINCLLITGVAVFFVKHTRENYRELREHRANMTLAEVLGVPPTESAVERALYVLRDQLATDTVERLAKHPMFLCQPFASCLRDTIAVDPNNSRVASWQPEKWRAVYVETFELAIFRCTSVTSAPLSRRELILASLERFLNADTPGALPTMKRREARFAIAAYMGLITVLGITSWLSF
ncbi:MAG: site-2 protease family protein [Candidatus Uhrbacteria bacterium]|nr:site-2 protease family protein [Candidatus Uhrbacteria bacterium]